MTLDQLRDDVVTWLQDPVVIAIAVAVVVLVVLLVTILVGRRRRRRADLERRFGAEYERTVKDTSRRKGEDDLERRTERHRSVEVRWLAASERERFRTRFESVQASFVDSPDSAVLAADGLVDEVAVARGYPETGPDDHARRLSDVSVDYPEEVAAHRRALAELAGGDERPSTEQLRKALLASRALFDRLVGVGDDAVAPVPRSMATATDEDEMVVVVDDDADGEPERDRDERAADRERERDSERAADGVREAGGEREVQTVPDVPPPRSRRSGEPPSDGSQRRPLV